MTNKEMIVLLKKWPSCLECRPSCSTCIHGYDLYPERCTDCLNYSNYESSSIEYPYCEYCGRPKTSRGLACMSEILVALINQNINTDAPD